MGLKLFTPQSEKLAYTVECFFNAVRMPDGDNRAELEQRVIDWLQSDTDGKSYAILHRQKLFLYRDSGQPRASLAASEAIGPATVWCNGKKISQLDAEQYQRSHTLAMLGAGALMLSMPGLSLAEQEADQQKKKNNNNE